MSRWNLKNTTAALSAISAMLAGEDKEGDWPKDVERDDLESAHAMLCSQRERIERRVAASSAKKLRKSSIRSSAHQIRDDLARTRR